MYFSQYRFIITAMVPAVTENRKAAHLGMCAAFLRMAETDSAGIRLQVLSSKKYKMFGSFQCGFYHKIKYTFLWIPGAIKLYI
jgi:hypothetical protein